MEAFDRIRIEGKEEKDCSAIVPINEGVRKEVSTPSLDILASHADCKTNQYQCFHVSAWFALFNKFLTAPYKKGCPLMRQPFPLKHSNYVLYPFYFLPTSK